MMKFQYVYSFILIGFLLSPLRTSAQKAESDNLKIQRNESAVINNFNNPKNLKELSNYLDIQKKAKAQKKEDAEKSLAGRIKKAIKEAEAKRIKEAKGGPEALINDVSKINLIRLDDATLLARQESMLDQLCKDTKEVRLDSPGYALSKMTDTIQAASTCYAHAAAQMYDAYRILYPPEKNMEYKASSISHISYLYKTYGAFVGTNPDGGDTRDVLSVLKKYHPCPRESVQIQGKEGLMDLQEIKINNTYKELCSLKDQFGHCSDDNSSPDDLKVLQKKYMQLCSSIKEQNTYLKNQNRNLKDIAEAINTSNILTIANDAEAFNCDSKNQSQKYDAFRLEINSHNRIPRAELIMSLLDRPANANLPIQIGFCSRRAYNPSKDQTCGEHAVTIIGKRFNKEKKTCEFYIHDSGYPASLDSKAVTNENIKSQKMWISVNQLMTYSYSMSTIEVPKQASPKKPVKSKK